MRRIIPWLYADLASPFCPVMLAADAMGVNEIDFGGYGIVASLPSEDIILKTFKNAYALGYTVPRLSGDLSGLRRVESGFTRTKPHNTLPSELFDGACEWTVLERGRWRFPDHVTLGEGRAVVRSVELAVLAGEHRCKLLQLEDNAPTSGSMTKGRSPAPALNYIARRKAARTLMSDIRMYLPWVESKVMPADEASRIIEC